MQGTSYIVQVRVYYTDNPLVSYSEDISFLFQDYCDQNVVITPPIALVNQVYQINDP